MLEVRPAPLERERERVSSSEKKEFLLVRVDRGRGRPGEGGIRNGGNGSPDLVTCGEVQ